MPSKSCPKCSGSMTEGYVIDRTRSGMAVGTWVEGAPETSIWTGLKLTGRSKIDVVTWRCGRCGFLEQYAAGGQSRFEARNRQTQFVVLIVAATVALVLGVLAALLAASR